MLLTRVILKDFGIYQGKHEFDLSTTAKITHSVNWRYEWSRKNNSF